ncbi:small monomeric GTPase [Rhizoctonia solani AG-1 IA]|uniref:Small monomeric GTPase n=1 Tax=Thanatephorus cucumeris (strain AG1-IA) TaxID=983506 RepID=L8WFT2_THACA|nr:small monomeric GTPase [Rhizoctonia solani AG-1 IA]
MASNPTGSPTNETGLLPNGDEKNSVVIKVGMVGDSQIGKTSLMVKYVEGSFDEDYIQTLGMYLYPFSDVRSPPPGVNFMEKTISVRRTTITFSIWDLGGQREFVNMLPLVCNDAVAILFMFDLTRKSTLNSVKEWYRQTAIPFLIGTKFDTFSTFPRDEQEEITKQAKRFAKAMHASLIFSSTSASINVQKIFKIVLAKVRRNDLLAYPLVFKCNVSLGIRLKMRDTRDRRCRRTHITLCRRLIVVPSSSPGCCAPTLIPLLISTHHLFAVNCSSINTSPRDIPSHPIYQSPSAHLPIRVFDQVQLE